MSPDNVKPADLAQLAGAGIAAAQSVGTLAHAEVFTPKTYSLSLAEHLRYTSIPLDRSANA